MPKGDFTKTKQSIVPLRGVVRNGQLVSLLDHEGNEIGAPVTSIANVTGGIGISVDGKLVGVNAKFLGRRPSFSRCIASNFAGAIASDAKCYGHAIALPGKFDAVRIGFIHSGGSGAVVGMTAAVAATDDVGDRSNTNTAAGRRFATPFRGGVEKNEYSSDGWSRVTVGGATSWGISDPGDSSKINIAWSDIIEVHGIEDSLIPGTYPLLVRVYGGTGVFTRTGNTGFADPARFLAEAGKIYAIGCSRVGAADAVGTLGNWANGNNVSFSDADCIAMIIEAWAADGVKTIMLAGDSRFSLPAPSLEATVSYRGVGFILEKALADLGKKAVVARCARGAQTNATIEQWANQYYATIQPDIAIRLCYAINNGVPTAALLATEKTRVLKSIDADLSRGVIPVLIPIFPYSTGFGAALPAVLDFNAWCKSLGVPYVDALERYGDALGGWKAGYNEDINHMTNTGYADLGGVALRDAVLALI